MRIEKMNDALKNTRSLKKASYRMLRRLHKLERKGGLTFSRTLGNGCAPLLLVKHLVEVIENCYDMEVINNPQILQLQNALLTFESIHKRRSCIDRMMLVSCLKKHTNAFNYLLDNKIQTTVTHDGLDLWRMKCLMSYVCQFGNMS